jgi:hypothetical protein
MFVVPLNNFYYLKMAAVYDLFVSKVNIRFADIVYISVLLDSFLKCRFIAAIGTGSATSRKENKSSKKWKNKSTYAH